MPIRRGGGRRGGQRGVFRRGDYDREREWKHDLFAVCYIIMFYFVFLSLSFLPVRIG